MLRYFLFIVTITSALPVVFAEPVQTEHWVGTNYTPAYACNQVHFWHDFRADVVEKELAAAKKYFALNTLRVYLHPINFEQDRENFFANLEKFLVICEKYGIKPGFTFFDDCHRHEGIFLDKPTEPVKGYHNGRWAASPQDRDRDINNLDRYKPYIQDVIAKYKNDARILWWETFNEPGMKNKWSVEMRKVAYQYAKEIAPKQPVLCCWDESPETDIVNAHNYTIDFRHWDKQTALNPDKGCVFTEAGARWFAPKPSNGEPVEVIRWLEERKRKKLYVPGVYLCWELMVGNSNCRWYWGTPQNTPEPTLPWCGLLWSDGTPVSLAEAEAVRHYVTGESKALFFDDFQRQNTKNTQNTQMPQQKDRDISPRKNGNWQIYTDPQHNETATGFCGLRPHTKQVAGTAAWTDYILESVVMLDDSKGNAGLMFRVNDPQDGIDSFTGYYIGFDTQTLYLGKMNNRHQPPQYKELQRFDLRTLDCKVVAGVWNQIRVAVKGNNIRVWFNRMHESADKQNGLRIDYTDTDSPVLAGGIGLRTFNCSAKFDNVIAAELNGNKE
ncbi:MAG: DUF1080 domain-containing protein [Planctomycetaceae bacterium]|jgi:hypothetical protein|nr:DUF1080 domain-containing protein [Planctomycetaceae bacterium]